jgi:hypothetical protein
VTRMFMADTLVSRFVEFVEMEVRSALPKSLPAIWLADECCRSVASAAAAREAAAREALIARATAFMDDVLMVVRSDFLPFEPETCLYVDFADRLQLIGTRRGGKIRIDEDMNIVWIREKPLALEGPRSASLRAEIVEVLTVPLAGANGKPVEVVRTIDLAALAGPGAMFVELDAPAASGYVGGRYDRLRAYGDGKLLLMSFRPVVIEDEFQPGQAAGTPSLSE